MFRPATNKITRPEIDQSFEDNAKLLEERLNAVNWKLLLRYYFYGLGIISITIFVLLVVIRLAFVIF